MPHFTIEYSANLDSRLNMGKIVEAVRKAAVETGWKRNNIHGALNEKLGLPPS
jgi:hypothetical protein